MARSELNDAVWYKRVSDGADDHLSSECTLSISPEDELLEMSLTYVLMNRPRYKLWLSWPKVDESQHHRRRGIRLITFGYDDGGNEDVQ